MINIEDYYIVKESSSYQLAKEVLVWIERGYKPQGGVGMVSFGFGSECWVQAMVKKTT